MMDVTRQITAPTPDKKFKQHLNWSILIASKEIERILSRIENLDRIETPLSTLDMSEKDALYKQMETINLKIAIITNIALDGL